MSDREPAAGHPGAGAGLRVPRRGRAVLVCALLLAVAGPARAAGGELGGGGLGALLWSLFNLALLVAALVYLARKPIRDYFAERRRTVADDLDTSAGLLKEAESRLAEWERRIEALAGELDGIRETQQRRTESDRRRILGEAEASAERIRHDASLAVEQELRRARERLREEAADLAVELATEILHDKVNDADRRRLVDEFIERVEREEPAAAPAAGR